MLQNSATSSLRVLQKNNNMTGEIEWGCCTKTTPLFCGTTVCGSVAQQDTTSSWKKD